jgi:hypothetical protein
MRHFSDFLGLVIERFIWSHFPYQSHVMIPGHYLQRYPSQSQMRTPAEPLLMVVIIAGRIVISGK